jgi:hypothetical protein
MPSSFSPELLNSAACYHSRAYGCGHGPFARAGLQWEVAHDACGTQNPKLGPKAHTLAYPGPHQPPLPQHDSRALPVGLTKRELVLQASCARCTVRPEKTSARRSRCRSLWNHYLRVVFPASQPLHQLAPGTSHPRCWVCRPTSSCSIPIPSTRAFYYLSIILWGYSNSFLSRSSRRPDMLMTHRLST